MQPGEYRAEQNQLTRPVVGAVLGTLRALPTRPLAAAELARLAAALFPPIVKARNESELLAATFFASQNPRGTVPKLSPAQYAPAFTAGALRRVSDRLADPDSHQVAATEGAAALGRHVEQAGREFVLAASAESSGEVRWARYDPQPPCCAWCTVFISRGPVYHTAGVRSGGFLAHPSDTCVAVPVFGNQDWPGREQYEAAEAFYVEHAAGAGTGRQIAAMRAAVAEHGSPI